MSTAVLLFLFLPNLTWAQDEPPRFPPLNNDKAWQHLQRKNPRLPVWARILAQPLPRTTAGMLELDYLHRVKNPIGAKLAAKLRWVAADANHCAYSKQLAKADLLRAGTSEKEATSFCSNKLKLAENERVALNFARKLTTKAINLTDDEFAEVVAHFGPEKTAAMAMLVAHANFQDRIFLSLGIREEPGGALPPLKVDFDSQAKPGQPAAKRKAWKEIKNVKEANGAVDPAWRKLNLAELRKTLESQKKRSARLPVPTEEDLAIGLPPAAKRRASTKVVWTRVCMTYQPKLTKAWFQCMNNFGREGRFDRVFGNSMFWVITRSNECFY